MRKRIGAAVAAVVVMLLPQQPAHAAEGWDDGFASGGCGQGDDWVSESPECQVEATADPTTGHLGLSYVASGRTSFAGGIAGLWDTIEETSSGVSRFAIEVDLRGHAGEAYVEAFLLEGSVPEGCNPLLGCAGPIIDDTWLQDGLPRLQVPRRETMTLVDEASSPGRIVTVVARVRIYYQASYLGVAVDPGPPTQLCSPLYGGYEPICAPVGLPPLTGPGPVWLGSPVPVPLGHPPAGVVDVVASPVVVTPG